MRVPEGGCGAGKVRQLDTEAVWARNIESTTRPAGGRTGALGGYSIRRTGSAFPAPGTHDASTSSLLPRSMGHGVSSLKSVLPLSSCTTSVRKRTSFGDFVDGSVLLDADFEDGRTGCVEPDSCDSNFARFFEVEFCIPSRNWHIRTHASFSLIRAGSGRTRFFSISVNGCSFRNVCSASSPR